jgi:hypothetical protein
MQKSKNAKIENIRKMQKIEKCKNRKISKNVKIEKCNNRKIEKCKNRKYSKNEQLGNLLSLCREIAGARDILQKFENLKKQHEWNFNL